MQPLEDPGLLPSCVLMRANNWGRAARKGLAEVEVRHERLEQSAKSASHAGLGVACGCGWTAWR